MTLSHLLKAWDIDAQEHFVQVHIVLKTCVRMCAICVSTNVLLSMDPKRYSGYFISYFIMKNISIRRCFDYYTHKPAFRLSKAKAKYKDVNIKQDKGA